MQTIQNGLEINFEVELVDGVPEYYGYTWANPDALLCDVGTTIEEMIVKLLERVENYA